MAEEKTIKVGMRGQTALVYISSSKTELQITSYLFGIMSVLGFVILSIYFTFVFNRKNVRSKVEEMNLSIRKIRERCFLL